MEIVEWRDSTITKRDNLNLMRGDAGSRDLQISDSPIGLRPQTLSPSLTERKTFKKNGWKGKKKKKSHFSGGKKIKLKRKKNFWKEKKKEENFVGCREVGWPSLQRHSPRRNRTALSLSLSLISLLWFLQKIQLISRSKSQFLQFYGASVVEINGWFGRSRGAGN